MNDQTRSAREVAKYFKVSRKKIAAWMKRGTLEAINVGTGKRPQYRFTPEAIRKAEAALRVTQEKRTRKVKASARVLALIGD